MNNINQKLISLQQINNVLSPITEANGMPNMTYTNPAYFHFEREQIFEKTWVCIGFSSDLIQYAYVKPVNFIGIPLLMVRNREGEIQIFHNVCSHRGMQLVQAAGVIEGVIRCPYHSWNYDLNGNLKGTPHVGGVGRHQDARFQCEKHRLKRIRSAVWMDMVFVNLSADAAPFEVHIAPLVSRWKSFLGEDGLSLMRTNPFSQLDIEVAGNWKLTVENYCEAYHLPWVHPALHAHSTLENHYSIMFDKRFAGQGSYQYNFSEIAATHLPKFPSWPIDKLRHAEYIAIFPNVLLGIQVDYAFAVMIDPIHSEKTIEKLRLYYVGDESLKMQYDVCRAATLESWKTVFNEDISVVEGMQKGRHSPGFNGGVFSPAMDLPSHFFQKWLATRVKAGLISD